MHENIQSLYPRINILRNHEHNNLEIMQVI